MPRWTAVVVATMALLVLFAGVWSFDAYAGASLFWSYLATVAALAVLLVGSVWLATGRAAAWLPLLPFLAALAMLPLLDTSPVKPFRRFYNTIAPGMAEADVLQNLDHHFPATGAYPRPVVHRSTPDHLGFRLDPHDGRYDAEIVTVDFVAGGVVQKEYLAD